MTAFGYVRKSVVHDAARMLSPEMQEAEIRRLAEYNHHDDIVIVQDLGISGTKDRTRRPGWNQVLNAIESGECKDLYAYSMSRLARSVDQLAAIRKLCTANGVGLHLVREKVDTTSAGGRLYWNLQASFEEFWADVTSERVKDAFATKRARDKDWRGPGQPPYGEKPGEDVMVVLEAFRESGSYTGAARILNEREVPTRVPGRAWSNTVVMDIIKRLAENDGPAKDDVLPRGRRGAPAGRRQFLLSGLLACSVCVEAAERRPGNGAGYFMTGSYDKRRQEVRYACSRARVIPHPRGWINEDKVLPQIMEESARAGLRIARARRGTAKDEARLAELASERERVKAMFRKGRMEEDEFDAAMAELDEEESKLSAVRWVYRLKLPPHPDFDGAKWNAYVRRLFRKVTVDMSQRAYRGPSKWTPALDFDWVDPTLRHDDDDRTLLEWPEGSRTTGA